MLMKTVDGMATRMFHKGIRYIFERNEVKDVPDTMLAAFRGVLISAEPIRRKMPIVQIESPKSLEPPQKIIISPKMTVVHIESPKKISKPIKIKIKRKNKKEEKSNEI